MKRIISIVLIMAQLIAVPFLFDFNSYAQTEEERLIELDLYNKPKDELQAKVNGTYVIPDSDILAYLTTIGGMPMDIGQKRLNPTTFRNYKAVAYGNPFGDKHETFKVDKNINTIEYRYLGYNKEDMKISNDQFANDFAVSSAPSGRDYQKKGDNNSWSRILHDKAQTYRILNENVLNDDIRTNEYLPTNYSVSSLLGAKANEYTSYVELMLAPTYLQEGVMRLWHRGKKGLYYDSMRLTPMDNMTLSTTMSVDKPTISISPTDTGEQVINLTVNSNIGIYPNYGQNETKYIKEIIQYVSTPVKSTMKPMFINKELQIDERPLTASEKSFTYQIPVKVSDLKEGESRTFEFKAKTQVKTAYDNTFVSNTETISVVVTKGVYVPPSSADAQVDFKIFIDGVEYTDSTYKVKDLNFTTPLTVTLKDASTLSGISPEYFYWYNGKTGELLQAGDTSLKDLNVTINSTNKSSFLDADNNISFKLKLRADNGLFYDSPKHGTNMLYVPAPIIELPHAVLFAQTRTAQSFDTIDVHVGEKVDLNGSRSFTKDSAATITDYLFSTAGFTQLSDSGKVRKGYFDKEGSYTQSLVVRDSKSQESGESEVTVNVLPPSFSLKINSSGTFKENRKVSFDIKQSDVPAYYPLDPASIKWTITALDGGSQINTGLIGKDSIDTQFLKKGRYKIRVDAQIKSKLSGNTKRYSSFDEVIIDIAEDKAPIVEFAVNKFKLRDPDNSNKVLVTVIDKSYSLDADTLDYGVLSYRYDSNDNGDFTDESEVIVSAAFNSSVDLILDQNVVGKFKFYLQRKEIPGQEYLSWNSAYDRISNSDVTMLDPDKILEVLNVAPTVVFDVDAVKTIDYVIATDFEGDALLNLQSQLEKLEAELLAKKINPNFIFYNGKKAIGNKTETKYRFIQKGYFTFNYDYDSANGSTPDQTYVQEFDWYSYDLWESDMDKLPKLDTSGAGYTRLPDTHEYLTSGEKVYQHYKVYGAGKEDVFDFRSESYNDKYGTYNVYYNVRNQNFRLATSYSKVALESTNRTLYSVDFTGLQAELDKYESPVLLLIQNNKFATANLKQDFADYMANNDIVMYTNIANMTNPTGLGEVKDIYNVYNSEVYYIEFVSGQILMYDYSLGLTQPVTEIPSNAVGTKKNVASIIGESGNSDTVFGGKFATSKTRVDSTQALNFYYNYSYLRGLPFKHEPFIINGKMLIRNRTASYNTMQSNNRYYWSSAESADYVIANDCVKILKAQTSNAISNGTTVKALYIDSLGKLHYIEFYSMVDVFYSAYGEYGYQTLTDKIINVPSYTDVINGLTIVDDVNKKAYDFNGNFITNYISRDPDGRYLDVSPTQRMYVGSSWIQKKDTNYTITFNLSYKSGSYTHWVNPVFTANVDSISHVFEVKNDTAFISNSEKITINKTNIPNSSNYYTIVKNADIAKIPNAIDFSSVFDSNPENRLVTELSSLTDSINSNTQTPYYNKTAYILLGSSLESSMLYADFEGDPIRKMSFDFNHDKSVFENDLGQDPSSGTGLSYPITQFNYTGLYTGKLHIWDDPNLPSYSKENQDNTEIKIYVHRKPIATAKWSIVKSGSDNYIRLQDNGSYDKDHMSTANKGVVKYKWTVNNKAYEGSSIDIKIIDSIYTAKLQVQDIEGAWSDPVTLDIDLSKILLSAELNKVEFESGETALVDNIITQSIGLPADSLKVELFKNNVSIKSSTFNSADILSSDSISQFWKDYSAVTSQDMIGSTLFFRLQATRGADTSNTVELPFTVISSNEPPTVSFVSVTPSTPYEGDSITAAIMPLDPDGDNLKVDYYIQKPAGSYVLFKTIASAPSGTKINLPSIPNVDEGTYKLKAVVSDGQYQAEAIYNVTVKGLSVTLDLKPTDPMAGDMLYFNISTVGYADRIEITLENDIVANDKRVEMGYNGVTYNGNKLVIPINNPTLNNSFTHQYIVWCTTPQSLTLKNVRLRSPYTFTVKAYRGDKVSNEAKIIREIQGDVRQLLKIRLLK